jgi:hypothetical protein
MNRDIALVVAGVLWAGVLGVGVLALVPRAAPQDRTYDRLVGDYLRGDVSSAIAGVKALLDPMQAAERSWLVDELIRTTNPAHHERLAAALMLHSELAFAAAGDRNLPGRDWVAHVVIMERLHDALGAAPKTLFIREWYLLIESFRQGKPNLDTSALDYLDEALARFPGDPALLLACGSHYELRWWNERVDEQRESPNAANYLARATDCLRRSVQIGHSLAESRLRLAHVLILSGDFDAAAAELGRLERTSDRPLRYLQHLFQGQLYERRGRRPVAATHYQAARDLVPEAQAAWIAAEFLQESEGERPDDPIVARRAMNETSTATDPLWWYLRGEWPRFEQRLREARTLVRR